MTLGAPVDAVAGALKLADLPGSVESVVAYRFGLSIDWGCFGDGGPVATGEASSLPVLLRDGALLVVAAGLAARRRPTPLSLDRRLPREGAR